MVSTRVRFLVWGGNPLHGSDTLDSRMGVYLWDLSLGQCTGDGRFDGETFLGGLLIFFLGERGRGRESARARSAGSVAGRRALSNNPILLYITC